MTVHSIAQQRGKHDDGRCHEPTCAWRGEFRFLCPYRGQHPNPCPHEHVLPKRAFKMHGFIDSVAPPRCTDCGQNLYEEGAADA